MWVGGKDEHWNGLLDWNTGMDHWTDLYWFLSIFWLVFNEFY